MAALTAALATLQTQHLKLHYFTYICGCQRTLRSIGFEPVSELVFPFQTIGKIQNANLAKQ
jgi:hypothetical protein